MESIGNVMQVTSHVAQQVSEANRKQLDKQPTEKSSDVFLGALNSDGVQGTLTIDRASPLFVLLIARLNGSEGNSNSNNSVNSGATNDLSNSSNTEVELSNNTTSTVSVAMTDIEDDDDNTSIAADNTNANTRPENTGNSVSNDTESIRSVPILGSVAVPTLGFAGNGGNTNQTNVPTNATVATNTPSNESSTSPSTDSSSSFNIPIFGNVTVPSLGTIGGASQEADANSTAVGVGSPLVRSSPVATQVGNGFQSLLAGNTSVDNNSGSSSHWRRGSSSSSSGNISSLFGR